MSNNTRTLNHQNNRRTFLKTVGIAMGAAGFQSTTTIAQQTDGSKQPTGWITRRANSERTGTIDATGPLPFPTTEWTLDPDGSLYNIEPIVTEETVYLAVTTDNSPSENNGYLGAYEVGTGDERWIQPDIPAPRTPTVGDELLYVPTKASPTVESTATGLYALDTESGDIAWDRTKRNKWTPPIVTDDALYTSNATGAYALDPASGETIWREKGVGGIANGFEGQVSYSDGTVIYADGTALNAEDGSTEWQAPSDRSLLGNSVADDNRVYYLRSDYIKGDDDRVRVEARSLGTGRLDWTYTAKNNQWDGRLALAQGYVLLIDENNGKTGVTALSTETGSSAWTQELHGDYLSTPTVANETIYLGGRYLPTSPSERGSAFIAALDLATGNHKWIYLLDSSDLETSPENPPAAGPPVVVDNQLYTATYPAGSALDYGYVYYSNVFVLNSCSNQVDDDDFLPINEMPDERDDSQPLKACIDVTSNRELSDFTAGENVWLNGFCSTGSDLQYEWDTNGDGQYDKSKTSVAVTVPECGSVTIGLKIMDSNENIDTASVTLSAT
ncbi:outer membrane protein assembly factor BamB family protein [Haladaptatus halobius]|uniref:outer membrane protein assembly factor BamB family protein n=1 Tax=Haladaptatus halobius TaxID=2884875 RepID=UPI001D0A4DF5|nr:PQQ-binding-like beta-propeller repeat protein [Haladaptatus halobius]